MYTLVGASIVRYNHVCTDDMDIIRGTLIIEQAPCETLAPLRSQILISVIPSLGEHEMAQG